MTKITLSEKEARDLEDTLVYHMEQCYNTVYDEDSVAEGFEPYQPFDGCSNCETREWLMKLCEWMKNNKDVEIIVGE